jgi:hypothetical protein
MTEFTPDRIHGLSEGLFIAFCLFPLFHMILTEIIRRHDENVKAKIQDIIDSW